MTLKQLREQQGVGLREVARRMGCPHPTVIRLETTGNATVKTLDKYANALGVPCDVVMDSARLTRADTSVPV